MKEPDAHICRACEHLKLASAKGTYLGDCRWIPSPGARWLPSDFAASYEALRHVWTDQPVSECDAWVMHGPSPDKRRWRK